MVTEHLTDKSTQGQSTRGEVTPTACLIQHAYVTTLKVMRTFCRTYCTICLCSVQRVILELTVGKFVCPQDVKHVTQHGKDHIVSTA